MIRTFRIVLVFAAVAASAAQAQVDPDSIQAWTTALESGTLPEKVIAASKLANVDVSSLPSATIDAAVAALAELEGLPDPIPGIEALGDEDLAGYQVDLVVLAAVADAPSADMALIPSVSVSVGVRRRVARLGDAAVPELVAMVAEERDAASALETLGLAWFWSDSVDASLSVESRAAIIGAISEVSESGSYRQRLGAGAALANTADPSLLALARDFRERMEVDDPRLVNFLSLLAIAPLEDRYEEATLLELTLRTSRLASAMCFGATGDLADVCVATTAGLDDAAQALAAGDSAAAAQAFEDVRAAAEDAFAAGTLTVAQRALLAGNAEELIEAAGGIPGGPVTLLATGDTDLRQGTPNQNQGDEDVLSIRASGRHRALIQVDSAQLVSVTGPIASARLEFDVLLNAENWGPQGRTIDAHRMLVPWTESGATWNCPNDTEPGDPNPDCSGTEWEMFTLNPSPYATTASGTLLVTGDLEGTVSIDVTSDVQAIVAGQVGSYGWIVRKTDEGAAGRIEIGSRESGTGPRLIIEPGSE